MMMKEVLILAMVVWMAMSAHTQKPPDYESKNDADTSVLVDKPSSPTNRTNFRTRRSYMLHGHDYWDSTGSNIPRQLRILEKPKKQTTWDKCEEKFTKTDTRTEQNLRTLRNYILHGYLDPTGQEISRQLRGRTNRKKTGNKALEAGNTANAVKFKKTKPSKENSHTSVTGDIISFDDFKSRFDKTYENEDDEKKRKDIFLNNVEKIEDHNTLYTLGKSSYKMKINEFSDMTNDEFVSKVAKEDGFFSRGNSRKRETRNTSSYRTDYLVKEPKYINYTQCDAMSPIRDQGCTQNCWAFSVVSSIESQIFLKYGKRVYLSDQYLADCCNCSRDRRKAFEYIISNGIPLNDTYKGDCNDKKSNTLYKIRLLWQVEQKDEAKLKNALVTKGPFTFGIHVSNNEKFRHLGEEVFDKKLCDENGKSDHAVLLVGYGTDVVNGKDVDYWLIRNSWGESWGDGGYGKVSRKEMKQCDIPALIPDITKSFYQN